MVPNSKPPRPLCGPADIITKPLFILTLSPITYAVHQRCTADVIGPTYTPKYDLHSEMNKFHCKKKEKQD